MTATDQARRLADLAAALRLGRELIGHDRWSAEQLAAHQRRRLGELVRHAVASSPSSRAMRRPASSSAWSSSGWSRPATWPTSATIRSMCSSRMARNRSALLPKRE